MPTQNSVQDFEIKAFELARLRPASTKSFLALCEEGIKLGKRYPEAREIIASDLVSAGAYLHRSNPVSKASINEYRHARAIAEYAMGLEWSGNHSDVDQAWENFRLMVENALSEDNSS